jgi:hypothetical protein
MSRASGYTCLNSRITSFAFSIRMSSDSSPVFRVVEGVRLWQIVWAFHIGRQRQFSGYIFLKLRRMGRSNR